MSQNRTPYTSRISDDYSKDPFQSSRAKLNRSTAEYNSGDFRSPDHAGLYTESRASEKVPAGTVDNAQYKNLEYRYRLLEEEKRRIEEDYKRRSENHLSTAAELRTAIQQLTVELEAKEREIERFRSEGQALSNEKLNQGEEAHQLRQEIENITRSLDKMKDDEGYLKKKNTSLVEELERVTAIKEKAESNVEEYSTKNNDLEKQNRDLEFQVKKSKQEIEAMQSLISRLNEELKERDRNSREVEQQSEEYMNVIRTLETKNEKLSELNDALKKDVLFYQSKCQEEERQKMDLENRLMEVESIVREKEFVIEDLRNNIDLIDRSRNDIIKDNYYFKEELNVTQSKIQQLDYDQQELIEIFQRAVNEEQGLRTVVAQRKELEDSRADMKESMMKSVSKIKALLTIS